MRRFHSASEADLPFLRWYLLLILAVLVLVLARLYYLQLVKHDDFLRASLDNLIESVEIDPPRGTILDRAGRVLAEDKRTYALLFKPPLNLHDYFLDTASIEFIHSLQASSLTELLELNLISNKAREDGLSAPKDAGRTKQAELPAGLDTTQQRWLKRLTPRELRWINHLAPSSFGMLSNLKQNPARLHQNVVRFAAQVGTQPYLNFYSGEPIHSIQALTQAFDNRETQLVELSYAELMQRCEAESKRKFMFQPFKLVDELNSEQITWIEEHRDEIPEGELLIGEFAFKRTYPLAAATAHVVGYTGLAQPQDKWALEGLGFPAGTLIGKEGVERTYEELLHGHAGQMDISVSHAGEMREIVREVPPERGRSLYLTLDSQVQAEADRLLNGRAGAIIVCGLNGPYAGDILALASGPSFDPNRFNETKYYASLIVTESGEPNPRRNLLNRAHGLAFPPGSTFKLAVAQAALQEGAFSAGSGFYCRGKIELGRNERAYHCHDRAGHRSLTLLQGISESCDVVFYEVSLGLGEDAPEIIKRYAEYFGFGTPTGIALPGEAKGLLPDKAWKRKTYDWANEVDRLWYDGDTVNYAIGQGFTLATPIQVLWSSNVVAWDGVRYPPRLLKAQLVDGVIVQESPPEAELLPLDLKSLAVVREGMRLAVTAGTCRQLNLQGLQVCAKSGTAETGKEGEDDHSWVTGYYPLDAPRYGFICFFQNGGSSGEAAVPAAREMLGFLSEQDPLGRSETGEQN